MSRLISICLLIVLFCSCSDKYQTFRSQYQFKSPDGKPDYASADYWAAHPERKDLSDSIPAPLRFESRDTSVDVFFLHPTTYTMKLRLQQTNAAIDDDYINAKTDYSSILYQASVFNGQCRVFAPRYRQAHINAFFSFSKEKADAAFALAYEDIKTAFQYYLTQYNKGRPFIIAGHSQGAKLAEWLLRDFVDGKALQKQLVTAYVIGWPLPEGYFTSIPVCKEAAQTGCVCSWRTFRNGYLPVYIRKDTTSVSVTNPLSWTTGSERAAASLHKGSILTKFNKVYPHTTDAQISKGVLWVKKPRFAWSFLYLTRNYHVGDINLFYMNMRENIAERIKNFQAVR